MDEVSVTPLLVQNVLVVMSVWFPQFVCIDCSKSVSLLHDLMLSNINKYLMFVDPYIIV